MGKYKSTIQFSISTVVLVITCVILMGGGHGYYTPAMTLFPWAFINMAWQNELSGIFMIAGLFQFIVYGFVLDKTRGTKAQSLARTVILVSHIILVAVILILRSTVDN